jgi:hypothetical protein
MDYRQVELAQLRTRPAAMDQLAWFRAVGGSPQSGVMPLWQAEVVLGPAFSWIVPAAHLAVLG